MTHFLRGKQAGIHNDLSAGLSSDLFVLDHVCLLSLCPIVEWAITTARLPNMGSNPR